jgi:HlyD family secretion protein
MKRRFWTLGVVVVAVLVLLIVVVRGVLAGPPQDARRDDVQAATRDARPLDEHAPPGEAGYVGGQGIVEPAQRETKLAGQVPGRIAALLVKEGDFVTAGTPVVDLENKPERAALAAAEADLDAARADLTRTLRGQRKEDVDAAIAEAESARERAESSRTTADRTEQLAKSGASTPDELDRARRQASADEDTYRMLDARRRAALAGSRQEDIVAAQARVTAAAGRRDQAAAQLDRLTVRAPLDGAILQIKFRVGEYYAPGGPDPLLVMGDTRTMRVRMDVDERDVARVALGSPAYATASAFPGRRFPGKVVEIGRRMGRKNVRSDDPTERIDTKILEVVLELDPPDGLVPGLRVTAYVQGKGGST